MTFEGPGYAEALYGHVPTTVTLPIELDPRARADREMWLAGGAKGTLLPVPRYAPTPDFEPRLAAYAVLPPGEAPDPRVSGVLAAYQPEGARYLNTTVRAFLADDTGIGKAIQAAIALPRGASVIYTCKATAVRDQIRKLSAWRPDFYVREWTRSDFNRWPMQGEIAVVSHDSLPRPTLPREAHPDDRRRALDRMLPWGHWGGILVLDEADSFRTPRTHKRLAAEALAARSGRCWMLTATPISNVPDNLKQLLKLNGTFRCAFHSEAEYDELMGVQAGREQGERHGRALAAYVSPIVEKERLPLVALRRTWKQVGGLAEARFSTISVALDPASLDALIAESGGAAAVLERVRRAGFQDQAELARLRVGIAAAKVPTAAERITEHLGAGAPVIVYCFHVEPLMMLQQALGGPSRCVLVTGEVARGGRYRAIEDFTEGRVDVIGVTDAGGDSVDLVRQADIPYQPMMRLDISWVPRANQQFIGRGRRPGMRWPVLVETLIGDHPLEERVHEVVAEKEAVMRAAGM